MSACATVFIAYANRSNPISDIGFSEDFSTSPAFGWRLAAAAEGSAVVEGHDLPPPPSVDIEVNPQLDLDAKRCIAGVSNDSRGHMSSMDVYRPMDRQWMAWCHPIVFLTSSFSLWNNFTLVSVVMFDHRLPRKPLLVGGSSMRGTGSG
jgi:hypothetical protein